MSLVGFTPEFADLLRHAGVTLDFAKGYQDKLAGNWGTFTDKNIDRSSPFYRLYDQGIKPGYNLISPETVSAIKKKQGVVSPDVQKLFDSVTKLQQQEADRGAADTKPHKGWFSKTLDIITRPGRAITTGIYRDEQSVKDAKAAGKPAPGFFRFGEFAKGAKAGFLGRDSKTGTDILRQQGVKNRAALFAGGLGIDVAADPTSYIGFGLGKKAIEQGAKVATTETASKDIATKLAAGPAVGKLATPTVQDITKGLAGDIPLSTKILTPSEKVASLKTGAKTIDELGTHLGAQAAKNAVDSLSTALTKVGLNSTKSTAYARRWLNPKFSDSVLALDPVKNAKEIATRKSWMDLINHTPGVVIPKVDRTQYEIYNSIKDTATKQLTEVLNANLEQQVKHSLTVKGLGLTGTLAPIPTNAIKLLDGVSKVNMVDKTLKVFNKTFNTGSRFDSELALTKARAAGKAEQRINIAQKSLVNAFSGIKKEDRKRWMNAFVGAPGLGHGVLTLKDGSDASDYITGALNHLAKYIDWNGDGSGILSLRRINSYLPNEYKMANKAQARYAGIGAINFKKMFMTDAEHFRGVDPQNFLYHMHIAVEKAVARDQTMKAISEFGIPKMASSMTHDLATGKFIRESSAAAKELVSKHGYQEITTKATRAAANEVDPSHSRYLKDKIFHPEIKAGLVRILNMMDDHHEINGLTRFHDKIMGYFKKAVTLPSPTYHIRNSIGDVMTSYLDDVQGLRGAASYQQAAKVMRALNPISKDDQLRNILEAAPTKSGDLINSVKEINNVLSSTGKSSLSGRVVMKKASKWKDVPGTHLSAEQIWAAYNHTGLKRGFVATDLEHELRGNPNMPSKIVHGGMQKILDFSQNREDYFRLAHFIDRLKRSKAPSFEEAAKDAAHYVKKFHFDYSDVTPTERAVFSRVMPFYKFTRFATPLITQMFFTNPGKIINAQKALNNIAYANGYVGEPGDFLPSADKILPQYMRDIMMLPLFETAKGATAFFNPGLPQTQIFNQTLGGAANSPGGVAKTILQSLAQSTTPLATTPAELYFGKRVLGGGDIPVQNKAGSYLPYLLSKTPLTNTAYNKAPGENGLLAIMSFLSGLGISVNTPSKQKGELYRQRDQITRNRQKDGYKKVKLPYTQSTINGGTSNESKVH